MLPKSHLHFILAGEISRFSCSHVFAKRVVDTLKSNGHYVTVHALPNDFPFPSEESLKQTKKCLSEIPPKEAIIVDSLICNAIPGFLKEFTGRNKVINLFHLPLTQFPGYTAYQREMLALSEREAFADASHIIALGPYNQQFVCESGIAPEKISLVYPGVDEGSTRKDFPKKPTKLLCVANFTRSKGHVTLVKALTAFYNVDWKLDCYGDMDLDREYLSELQALIRRSKLQNKIFIHGTLSHESLLNAYTNADLFVHPSEYETYGIALTEALAHGIPVIASTGGGIMQTVPENMGRFFKPGNVYGLETVLEALFDNQEIYYKLCTETSKYRKQAISWQKSVQQFEDALLRAIEK